MVDSVASLSSYFTSLVNSLMEVERQPLTRLTTQRDTMNVTRAVYSDLSTKLSDLQSSVRGLISSRAGFALTAGRSVNVSNVASGFTVLSASVTNTAVTGTYNITDIVLGKEQRVRSDQQASSDQALNLSGTILLGGAAERSVSAGSSTAGQAVNDLTTGSLATGQAELGSGAYTIQTRLSSGTYQFRLVDANGNAVSIQSGTSKTFTNTWQNIPTGETYDTGRGLKISFGANASFYQAGSAALTYTARGVSIAVNSTDSLSAIASNINTALFPTGQGVSATVVDRQLVLAGTTPGIGHNIMAQDVVTAGKDNVLTRLGVLSAPTGGFANVLQNADTNTSFKVNGQLVTRSSNTNLSDVISGVTINLSPDSAGKSATINVTSSWAGSRSAVDSFVSKFNDLQTYLSDKTGVTKNTNGTTTTYTRGALASDSAIDDLRGNLFNAFYTRATGGSYGYLNEIGLTINDSLQVSVSDGTKLENALNTNYDGVKAIMDQVMGRIDTILSRFTGGDTSGGYLRSTIKSLDNQLKEMGTDITDLTARLADRRASLEDQYASLQAQILQMSYDQQAWASISSYTSSG